VLQADLLLGLGRFISPLAKQRVDKAIQLAVDSLATFPYLFILFF
jgi:hypothetical protein